MNKKGFASMYIVYSFFLVFIMTLFGILMINHYKRNFLNNIKTEIKESLINYSLK